MKPFNHFSEEERDKIAVFINRGKSLREVALQLGRHVSSISRELKRNSRRRCDYRPHRAQERALQRRCQSHKKDCLKSHALRLEVERLLQLGWSPELVAGHLKERRDLPSISHESIYQWIYEEAPHLIGCLVRSDRTRWPKGKRARGRPRVIPYRISILNRPPEINSRNQPGHWETDLIVGKGSCAVQVLVERKTRLTRLKKVHDKTALSSRLALDCLLKPLLKPLRRSVTYDNGPENQEHHVLNQNLGTDSYFCEPYHSWEKGTVENTNGLIRRFFPKRTNFDTISDAQIQQVESWLNHRPRKCLNFKSPAESFDACVALAG